MANKILVALLMSILFTASAQDVPKTDAPFSLSGIAPSGTLMPYYFSQNDKDVGRIDIDGTITLLNGSTYQDFGNILLKIIQQMNMQSLAAYEENHNNMNKCLAGWTRTAKTLDSANVLIRKLTKAEPAKKVAPSGK